MDNFKIQIIKGNNTNKKITCKKCSSKHFKYNFAISYANGVQYSVNLTCEHCMGNIDVSPDEWRSHNDYEILDTIEIDDFVDVLLSKINDKNKKSTQNSTTD